MHWRARAPPPARSGQVIPISGEGDTETAETGKSSHPRPSFQEGRELGGMALSCPVRCHWRRRGGSSGPASWIIPGVRLPRSSMSGAAGLGGGRCDGGSTCCPPHFSRSRYGWPPHPNVCPLAFCPSACTQSAHTYAPLVRQCRYVRCPPLKKRLVTPRNHLPQTCNRPM